MLCTRNSGLVRSTQVVRAASSSIWGTDTWRYDKESFKKWVVASTKEGTAEQQQMYGYLALSFGDVDVDKDGWINEEEFNKLLEKVAALPRRFGLAPSWQVEYGTVEKRDAARKAMFAAIDGFEPRGKIALGQFLTWSRSHLAGKAGTIGDITGDVAFRNIQSYTSDQYLAFLDKAVNDPSSGASASFYNYLLTTFVEADNGCKGKISFEEFNRLVDLAAATPRYFRLAPDTSDAAARRKMFDSMDSTKSGFITFRKFLRFTREHVRAKLAAHGK